ncbi:MAG: hypothetical protein AMS19_06195 [Gemmatimonas sp. SG8_23]|nr:MAG: hypothetical protein AMS19_06195 [Gemmatimonas sp. SG8_23]
MRGRGASRFAAAAGLMLLPASALAQAPALEARVDAATLDVVQPVLRQAVVDSLPLDALRAKVFEGVAKGAPPDRIGRVVAELANEFRAVRAGLRTQMPAMRFADGEVVAATMARRQGVPFEDLAQVWQARPSGASLEVPVTVLGELVRRGVPIPDAAGVMNHVVRQQIPLDVAIQIPGRFDGARGAGSPPGQALAEALRALNIPDPPGRGRGRRPGG